MNRRIILLLGVLLSTACAEAAAPTTLLAETSQYNRGALPGRYRDDNGRVKRFALAGDAAPLYDGGGREIGQVRKPVMLNSGAVKTMAIDGRRETYLWAWNTDARLSGWIARKDLVDPPVAQVDPQRNPPPPGESKERLVIDATAGREKLAGLRHVNSAGVIPTGGGNRGEHYAGRNPEGRDYVYLLFAVPNVQRGGLAKDSLPDGSRFVPALDEGGNLITETMTMYREGEFDQPVQVTFLYGRAEEGDMWGWIARANVGDR